MLNLKAERRYALLVAYLFELSQDLTDQAVFEALKGRIRSGDVAVVGCV